jgi:hypothetical protein
MSTIGAKVQQILGAIFVDVARCWTVQQVQMRSLEQHEICNRAEDILLLTYANIASCTWHILAQVAKKYCWFTRHAEGRVVYYTL